MKHNTPDMADSLNGELTLKADKAQNLGSEIWNPITGRHVGMAHFKKLQSEGFDLSLVKRNNWIDGFDGSMSDKEFIKHVNEFSEKLKPETPAKKILIKDVYPATDLTNTIITQANQIDVLTHKLNSVTVENRELKHEIDKLRDLAVQSSKMADSIVRQCDELLGFNDKF